MAVQGTGTSADPLGTPAPGPASAPAGEGAALSICGNPLGSGANNYPLGTQQ